MSPEPAVAGLGLQTLSRAVAGDDLHLTVEALQAAVVACTLVHAQNHWSL